MDLDKIYIVSTAAKGLGWSESHLRNRLNSGYYRDLIEEGLAKKEETVWIITEEFLKRVVEGYSPADKNKKETKRTDTKTKKASTTKTKSYSKSSPPKKNSRVKLRKEDNEGFRTEEELIEFLENQGRTQYTIDKQVEAWRRSNGY